MKRLGAFVLAALMVAAAFAARGALDGDGDGDATGEGQPQASGIVCARDLAEVCQAAGIRVAATTTAGDTADALIGADDASGLGGQAWLTTTAWASVVMDERARNRDESLFEIDGGPLASSGVVLAIWADRAEQLASRCGLAERAAPGWRCLAEQSGTDLRAGDRVRVASPDVDSAVGLVVAASQTAGLLGRSDFASNDFEVGDLRSLAADLAAGQGPDPLRAMRSQGPGRVTAAGTVAAGATNLSTNFGTIRPTVPEPVLRADVVLVVPDGATVPADQRTALADALRTAGWDAPSAEPSVGPSVGPSGGVLAAIRTLWSQNR